MNTDLKRLHGEIKLKYMDLINSGFTYNQIIVEMYKIESGAKEFLTLKKWQEKGFKVKKDEKGKPIFSKPKKVSSKRKTNKTIDIENDGENSKNYFFTAYVFNEFQVEQITINK